MTERARTTAFLCALGTMLALCVAVQVARDRTFAYTNTNEVLYFTSGNAVRRAALSYDAVLADVYWIRALQHFGRERLGPDDRRRFDSLYPLLDIATTLDPLFTVAYRFGAIFLAEAQPGGAGRADQAIALLRKGIEFNPEKWDYFYDIGFIYYWHLHDYENAALWFEKGSAVPGAPWWLKTYAAVMLTRGGDRAASRAMWTEIGRSEDNDWLRNTARTRLAQLDALDQIDGLMDALQRFAQQAGREARSWQELIAAGVIPGVPLDPSGLPYVLDADTSEIGVDRSSPLWPLPTEPAAAPELMNRIPPVPPQ